MRISLDVDFDTYKVEIDSITFYFHQKVLIAVKGGPFHVGRKTIGCVAVDQAAYEHAFGPFSEPHELLGQDEFDKFIANLTVQFYYDPPVEDLC